LKSASEELLELIHGLTGAEKRYFRRFAQGLGGEGDRVYLRLYDFLASDPAGDDAAIRAHFAGEKFLHQLPVAKRYLHDLILDALRAFDRGKSPSLELADRLNKIELLFRRRLYKGARRQVQQMRKLADALDMPLWQLDTLRWDMRLVRALGEPDMPAQLAALHAEERQLLAAISLEAALLGCYDQAFVLTTQHGSGDRAAIAATAEALGKAAVLGTPIEALTFEGKILLLYTQAWIGFLTGDATRFITAHRTMLGVWEANEARLRLEPERYFRTLFAFLNSILDAGQPAEVTVTLAKLRRQLSRSKELERSNAHRVYHLELLYFLRMERIDEAARAGQDLADALSGAEGLTAAMRFGSTLNLATLHFCLERWADCSDWLKRLERLPEFKARPELTFTAQLLRVVLALETGDFERAEHLSRRLQQRHEAPDSRFHPEMALLAHLLAHAEGHDRRPDIHTALHSDRIAALPFAIALQRWATARLHSRSIRAVMQARG
jgi:hypothetical protein